MPGYHAEFEHPVAYCFLLKGAQGYRAVRTMGGLLGCVSSEQHQDVAYTSQLALMCATFHLHEMSITAELQPPVLTPLVQ